MKIESREVFITHYINPNSFWIKFDENDERLDEFDQQIQKAVTTKLATLLSCKFKPLIEMVTKLTTIMYVNLI